MAIKVFITHASEDRALVKAFVNALEASIAISPEEIRCTSLPGYRLRTGNRVSDAVRAEIAGAAVVIGVLTPWSLEAGWILFELGCGWGVGRKLKMLTTDVNLDSLPGALQEFDGTDATSGEELQLLFGELASELGCARHATPASGAAIDDLVEEANGYDDEDYDNPFEDVDGFDEDEDFDDDFDEDDEEDELPPPPAKRPGPGGPRKR